MSHRQADRHILCQCLQWVSQLQLNFTVCTLGPGFFVWNGPQWGDYMCPEGVKTFLLSLWKILPAVIRWGEIFWVCLPASVCYSGTILRCLFSETVDVQLPHHTDRDPVAAAATSLLFPHVNEGWLVHMYVRTCACVCLGVTVREVKVSFSLVCAWTVRINQGSEDDEYNYNNMTNLMLKPQNWQDCCCLFSLKQLKNQSLYMFHTLSLEATYCSHKEVIRSRLSIFLQCILVLM